MFEIITYIHQEVNKYTILYERENYDYTIKIQLPSVSLLSAKTQNALMDLLHQNCMKPV